MLSKYKISILALASLVLPAAALAQGRIVPYPRIEPPVRVDAIFVKSMFVDADIDRQVATTTIEQVFHNGANRVLEGLYLFPIPERASITSFSMWMNGEEVEGEVVEAKEARRIYEDIVRRMRDPGLLEYVGRDLFRARVFPIPARGDVEVKIVYEEVLNYDAGLVEYRHPLKADGNRKKPIGQVSISVDLRCEVPVKSLYSPTHDIDAEIDGRTASCGFELKDAVLDRDFVVYYTVSKEDVGLNLLSYRERGENGYFLMLMSPGRLGDPSKVIPKDVVFVVDKSGSMKGDKIEQAKDALSYCVQRLNNQDRFNIVLFSTNVTTYSDRLVRASRPEKRKASEFIDGITARGGTDINNALLAAFESPASDRPRMVIFLTDGLPTVGETDVETILASLRGRGDSVRIFPFGVGYDVNTFLLDRLGTEHHGAVDYIRPEEDIETKVSRFYDKVSNPVLSGVELEVEGVELREIYPTDLPDIFDGTQMVVLGRYNGTGSTRITLSGNVQGRRRVFDYEGTFDRQSTEYGFIPRIWANRKIAYLLSEIKLHGAERELVDEVIELSLEHGIITPYTSYLILEEGTEGQREQLSRAVPEGTTWGDVSPVLPGAPPPRSPTDASARTVSDGLATGKAAVGASKYLALSRDASSVVIDGEVGAVRYAAGKRFVLRGEEWVDESFRDDMEVTEIQFLSDRYFELLDEHEDIEEILALGENVTFVIDHRAYRISS